MHHWPIIDAAASKVYNGTLLELCCLLLDLKLLVFIIAVKKGGPSRRANNNPTSVDSTDI